MEDYRTSDANNPNIVENKVSQTKVEIDPDECCKSMDYEAEYYLLSKKCYMLEQDLEKYKVALLNLALSHWTLK